MARRMGKAAAGTSKVQDEKVARREPRAENGEILMVDVLDEH